MVKALNKAFTLIEILMVMVVMGVMATIISPWLLKQSPQTEIPQVLNEFNDLAYFARQEAIANQKNYRLYFRSDPAAQDYVLVEKEELDPEKKDKKIYKQAFTDYFETKYLLPKEVRMKYFYQGKKNRFSENNGEAYCYVVPNGLMEDAIINIERKSDGQETRVSFKLSPFIGRFEQSEGFLKPEK